LLLAYDFSIVLKIKNVNNNRKLLWPPRPESIYHIFSKETTALEVHAVVGIAHSSWLCRRRDFISYYYRKHPCLILILFNDKADIILLCVPIESTESLIAAPVVPIESTESSIAAAMVPPTIVIRIAGTGTAIRITIAIV